MSKNVNGPLNVNVSPKSDSLKTSAVSFHPEQQKQETKDVGVTSSVTRTVKNLNDRDIEDIVQNANYEQDFNSQADEATNEVVNHKQVRKKDRETSVWGILGFFLCFETSEDNFLLVAGDSDIIDLQLNVGMCYDG